MNKKRDFGRVKFTKTVRGDRLGARSPQSAAEVDPDKIRVALVDYYSLVREGLKRILSEAPDIEVVREATNADEAVKLARVHDFDVMLLDTAMPGQNGMRVLEMVKNERPELKVLIISMFPENQYAVRTLKAGASGYLSKESGPEQLMEAVRRVAQGHKYVSAATAEQLALEADKRWHGTGHKVLSDREFELLRLIGLGNSVGEIAKQCHLSVKTVSTYRTRLLDKLQLKTTADLIRYAVKNGLVD